MGFTGPFGEVPRWRPTDTVTWSGRLFAFSGRATDTTGRAGLREIAFLECTANTISRLDDVEHFVMPLFGGSDITTVAPFNDAHFLDLDPQRPIISITLASGWVVEAIRYVLRRCLLCTLTSEFCITRRVTYRLRNGETRMIHHGSRFKDGSCDSCPTLTLNGSYFMLGTAKIYHSYSWTLDDEYISRATGKSGIAENGERWMGDCIHRLQLSITNAVTGDHRTFGKCHRKFWCGW